MMLSMTAPRMEKDEMKKEWIQLSRIEKAKARADVTGIPHNNNKHTRVSVNNNIKSSSYDHHDDDHYDDYEIETLEFINKKLNNLNNEINKIDKEKKYVYDLAQTIMCPDYVNDNNFKLLFLRAGRFDTKLAAERIVKYWDEKFILFGPERAFKKLTIDDLNDDDIRIMKDGGIVVLPNKDKSNRGIIFSLRSKLEYDHKYIKNQIRVIWYIIHSCIENDIDLQRNGIVHLASSTKYEGACKTNIKLDRWMARTIIYVLPVRWVAVHNIVRRSKLNQLLMPFWLHCIGSDLRARYREYNGHDSNKEEYLAALSACGMSLDILPQEIGGSLPII